MKGARATLCSAQSVAWDLTSALGFLPGLSPEECVLDRLKSRCEDSGGVLKKYQQINIIFPFAVS